MSTRDSHLADEELIVPRDVETGQWKYRVGALALALVFFGLWELLPRLGLVSEIILPRFSDTMIALYTLVLQPFFPKHLRITLYEIFMGFTIGTFIGLTIGITLGVWEGLRKLTYPFVVAFQAIPKIVLAPLFIAWFGYGTSSKVVMAVAIGFFPVLINTMVGIENVPGNMKELMRSLRATRWQSFRKAELPAASPLIFAGIKTALTFALIGAIVGEFVAASEGLGYLLDTYNFALRIDRVFSLIIILSAIGAIFYFALEWLDRRLITWRED
jgi:NitT/TauT family transport system permease protein